MPHQEIQGNARNRYIADEALIQRALRGENKAFEELYTTYYPRIHAVVARNTANYDEVEDLVQNTFIRAFEGLGKFNLEAAFLTWLTEIALNVSRSHHRALMVRRKWFVGGMEMELLSCNMTAPGYETPEEALSKKERNEFVRESIQALPTRWKEVMWMRYVKDWTYKRIAQELGVPMGTVKIWLYRARQRVEARIGTAKGRITRSCSAQLSM